MLEVAAFLFFCGLVFIAGFLLGEANGRIETQEAYDDFTGHGE